MDENIKYLIEKTEKDFAAFIDLDFNIIVGSLEYHIEADEYHNSSEFRDFLIELTMEIREDLRYKYRNIVIICLYTPNLSPNKR